MASGTIWRAGSCNTSGTPLRVAALTIAKATSSRGSSQAQLEAPSTKGNANTKAPQALRESVRRIAVTTAEARARTVARDHRLRPGATRAARVKGQARANQLPAMLA